MFGDEVPEDFEDSWTSTMPKPTSCCRALCGYRDRCDLLVGLEGLLAIVQTVVRIPQLFLQKPLGRGVLGRSFMIPAAHTDEDLDLTVVAVGAALSFYRRAIESGSTEGCSAAVRGHPR